MTWKFIKFYQNDFRQPSLLEYNLLLKIFSWWCLLSTRPQGIFIVFRLKLFYHSWSSDTLTNLKVYTIFLLLKNNEIETTFFSLYDDKFVDKFLSLFQLKCHWNFFFGSNFICDFYNSLLCHNMKSLPICLLIFLFTQFFLESIWLHFPWHLSSSSTDLGVSLYMFMLFP